MDLGIPSAAKNPKIDRQFMIKKLDSKTGRYKIKSSFSFAGTILKATLEGSSFTEKDFFRKRIQNLNYWIQDTSLSSSCRGGIYEEIIQTSFQRAARNSNKINLVGHTPNYLKYANDQKIPTQVIFYNFS